MAGTLHLIPNTLGDTPIESALPAEVINAVRHLKHFIVESEKSARAFLMRCGVRPPFEGIQFHLLNKHTSLSEKQAILRAIGNEEAGILSDAGVPAVADPGANIILLAHQQGWTVKPHTGPSSILLALMASGFNGQAFTFHGYLPVKTHERQRKLKELEETADKTGYTQIFIETPFRNEAMFDDILAACKPQTLLSIACDITLDSEQIRSAAIEQWKKKPELRGRPAVFAIWVQPRREKKGKYN